MTSTGMSLRWRLVSTSAFLGITWDIIVATTFEPSRLPAQRGDASRPRIHAGAIVVLAIPFAANGALQTLLTLTDAWFIGRISVAALAAMSAIYWPIIIFSVLFGGVGLGGQTIVAMAFGGRRYRRAAQAAWIAVWAAIFSLPALAFIAWSGRWFLRPFGVTPEVEDLALAFWQPRMLGAPIGIALGAVLGFFNGIGRPRITFVVNAFVLTANAVLAQLLIFELDLGMSGAAWATNCAQALGLAVALYVFVSPRIEGTFHSRLMWRPRAVRLWTQLKLGFPMGLLLASDVVGFALFQLMQVRLSPVDGAAAQVVMMLTSIAVLPGVGLAIAGSTLVGQSIGMGQRPWARKVGNATILLCAMTMGCIGLLLGLCSPWLIPAFVPRTDPLAADVIRLAAGIVWIAVAYQFFDGLNLASGFCLRGVGDALVPASLVIALSWILFVPLTHMLSFGPGAGWVDWLPQFGLGAIGGWVAALTYIVALSALLTRRWRSPMWERIHVR